MGYLIDATAMILPFADDSLSGFKSSNWSGNAVSLGHMPMR